MLLVDGEEEGLQEWVKKYLKYLLLHQQLGNYPKTSIHEEYILESA